jgi:predicted transcriptional regulator
VGDEDFKLFSTDDTIRQLMEDAGRSPDVKWRMELLHKIDKQSSDLKRIGNVTVAEFKKLRKDLRHVLSPLTLQETIDRRIEERLKPRDREVNRLWTVAMWLLEKFGTIAIGVICTLIGIKAMHT